MWNCVFNLLHATHKSGQFKFALFRDQPCNNRKVKNGKSYFGVAFKWQMYNKNKRNYDANRWYQ